MSHINICDGDQQTMRLAELGWEGIFCALDIQNMVIPSMCIHFISIADLENKGFQWPFSLEEIFTLTPPSTLNM